ncbi:hypothetical protein OS493_039188, partial [Desmophyllum pertusum]
PPTQAPTPPTPPTVHHKQLSQHHLHSLHNQAQEPHLPEVPLYHQHPVHQEKLQVSAVWTSRADVPGYSASDCEYSGWVLRTCRKSCNAKCDATPLRPQGSCADPLGLGWDNRLPDSAFTASSQLSPGGGWWALPSNARLYFEDDYDNKRIGSWCAVDRSPQWLRIDLGQTKTITGIATQGRDVFVEHVKKYELAFSTDGTNFKNYEENGKSKVFDGNCDNFTPVLNRFNPVKARYVKVLPRDSPSTWVCMRVELYGCAA